MTDHKSHNGHGEGVNGGGPPRPEYIILDDDDAGSQSRRRQEFADIVGVAKLRFPWYLRILFLLAALLCATWCIGSIVFWSFLSLLHLVTFYRFDIFEVLMQRFWLGMVRGAAFTVGFLIALISPSLGLGFIMLYISLYEDGQAMMAQVLRNNFKKYSK